MGHHVSRFTYHAMQAMQRRVKPELLDELPPADSRALRSRRDLRRVNSWMGHASIIANALRATSNGQTAPRIVELGAGDGTLLLRVARLLGGDWRGTSVLLLDRLNLVSPDTRRGFEVLGWRMEVLAAEASAWLELPGVWACDTMLTNLFLHHFSEAQLAAMLLAASRQAGVFVSLEPRRSERSLLFSRLLWLIGCNQVTRSDAATSVRAGFAGEELSRLWPASGGWTLHERPAGSFSHLFMAQRRR
jgi:hypothetical protein